MLKMMKIMVITAMLLTLENRILSLAPQLGKHIPDRETCDETGCDKRRGWRSTAIIQI